MLVKYSGPYINGACLELIQVLVIWRKYSLVDGATKVTFKPQYGGVETLSHSFAKE